MVKIRLARGFRKGESFYRVVAIDERKKVRGQFLEILGFVNKRENLKEINKKGIDAWVKKGAKISPAIQNLLK